MPPLAIPPAISPAKPSPGLRRAEWATCALLLGATAILVGLRPDKAIDFRVYWLNARHYFSGTTGMYGPGSGTAWAGGVYRYPPLFLDLFRPLAALPFTLGALLWAEVKVICAMATVAALARRWHLSSPLWFWPGLLLLAPYGVQELRFGNAQLLIVLLVIWAFLAAEHHPRRAGAILGLAIALKVWPLFFLPCLLALRRWRFAVASAAAGIVWTLAPMLWRAPRSQLRLLGQWLAQERGISAAAARAVGFWYPGQSLHDVLARYLAVVNYGLLPDARYGQVAWLHLSPAALQWVWWTIAATLTLALLVVLARRCAAPADVAVAFLFCALLVLQPHVHRIIYVSLAWPALWFASERAHGRLKGLDANLYWLAVAAAVLEPLIPGGSRQRWLQVYGTDFWLVLLPLTVVAGLRLWQSVATPTLAKANSG